MTEISHASIVPLIGGETLGAERAHGRPPEYFLSYSPFMANDEHIINDYRNRAAPMEVPYYLLDKGQSHPYAVDVVHSVCPCAGLSMMSHGFGDHNPNNQWMIKTTEYVLGVMKPKVLWGENAPGFAGKIGKNVRTQMRDIARKNGYTMSVYRTRSLLHGVPQVRERSFYFFWHDTKVPILNYYSRPYKRIEELIRDVKSNFQHEVINKKIPSEDPTYRYILEKMHGGITHAQFTKMYYESEDELSVRGMDVNSYIERSGHDYMQVAEWSKEVGLMKDYEKNVRRYEKLKAGGSIMRRGVIIPKDRIGAFVGHYPTMLTHPDIDRFVTYREAMTIMGLPDDFELVNASPTNANHICQNVPVQTATDMATEVVEYLRGNRKTVDTDYVLQYNGRNEEEYEERKNTLEGFL